MCIRDSLSAFYYKIVYTCFYNLFELNAFINAEEFPAFQTDEMCIRDSRYLVSCAVPDFLPKGRGSYPALQLQSVYGDSVFN